MEEVDEGLSIPVATVEDLIIRKVVAGRPQDWNDIQRLIEIHLTLDTKRI